MGELLALVALVLFALNTVLTKVASRRVPIATGFLVAVFANTVVGAALAAAHLAWTAEPSGFHGRSFLLFLLGGVFTTFLGRWFFFESVARYGPARASIFQTSIPVFTVVIAWLWIDERLAAAQLLGIATTVAGLFLVVWMPAGARVAAAASPVGAATPPAGWLFRSSAALGVAAGLAYAIGNVMRGAALRDWNEPVIGGFLGALSGLVLQVAASRRPLELWGEVVQADRFGVLLFVGNGVMMILAQILTIAAMQYVPVSVSVLITSCVPVFVIPMSYWLLKNEERITATTIGGTALAVLGITLILLA